MTVVVMYLEGEKRVSTPPGYPTSVNLPFLEPTTEAVADAIKDELSARGVELQSFEFAWIAQSDPAEETVQ